MIKSPGPVYLFGFTDVTEKSTQLDVDLNTAFRATLLKGGEQVRNVVPRMSVQASAQSLLVEVVRNQTDATAEHEQTVQDTHLQVILNFLGGEGTAVAEEINEANGNATIDIQDEVILLRSGHGLNSDSIVEQLGAGEVLFRIFFNQLDTEIRVVAGLDSVSNTGDCRQLAFQKFKEIVDTS